MLTRTAPSTSNYARDTIDSLDLTLCLRHVDDSTELNFSLAGRRGFFSEQLGCNPAALLSLSCLILLDSQDFLPFHSECFKGILHGRAHQHRRSIRHRLKTAT